MTKEYPLLPLFEQFIRDSYSGRRSKPNGEKIKPQTIDNYTYVLRLLQEFQQEKAFGLRIKPAKFLNKKQIVSEKNYWKKFYTRFADFLYRDKQCYDNYAGNVIKIIKSFFAYLNKDRILGVGDFYKAFYVKKEEIPVITLLPSQLQYLLQETSLEQSLPA